MPNIDDLRVELFDTIKRLKAKDEPMEVARAKAIVEVAAVLVETAKVEISLAEAVGHEPSDFVPERKALPAPRAATAGR